MKRLLSILASAGMIASTGAVAVACQDTTPSAKMTEIKTLIKNTNLDELADSKSSTIIKKVLEKNADSINEKLVAEDLQLKGEPMVVKDKEMKAIVTVTEKGKEKNFTGEVEVMFTVKEVTPAKMTEISTLIKEANLGEVDKTDSETIVKKVFEKNPDLSKAKLEVTDLELKTPVKEKDMKAIIKVSEAGKAKNFTGEVEVMFTVKQPIPTKVEISTLITVKQLGKLDKTDNQAIIKQVLEKNKTSINNKLVEKDLKLRGEATVVEGKKMKVTITVSEEGAKKNFTGEVEVTFETK
ncbi:lipoprotein [Mycoplasma putrefaciens]|uniref:lipoprotein n=1 Tax=Mycoplasma putrefaciens TaxID=2123 RepID=UPI003DA220C6